MALSEWVLVLMGLLALSLVIEGLGRRLPLPFTVLLVLVGMGLAQLEGSWPLLEPLADFRLSPELVFFVLLPALIFESAFNLDARQLLRDWAPILTMAVPALLLSTAVVGLGLHWLSDLPLLVALLFGALISATDPVAVVALFKELGAPLRLMVLVEGESLLNDATAIVVFGILLGLLMSPQAVDASLGWWAIYEFVRVFVGGIVVGVVFGVLLSELAARLKAAVPGIVVFSLIAAYGSFVVGEHLLHVSGVMAAMACAIAFSGFGLSRLPLHAGGALRESWEVLALVGNAMLFLLVGLSVDVGSLVSSAPLIGAVFALTLLARALAIYGLLPSLVRLFGLPKVGVVDRHVMWWGGLKGGLAIAIVLSIPEDLPQRALLFDLTMGVVLATLLINAPTIRPLMTALGLMRLDKDEQAAVAQERHRSQALALAAIDGLGKAEVMDEAGVGMARGRLQEALDAGLEPEAGGLLRGWSAAALRAQLRCLDALLAERVLSQYSYLDLKAVLRRLQDRPVEALLESDEGGALGRWERALMRRLRERNWAAAWLARYQSWRLAMRFRRLIAEILMADAALAVLPNCPFDQLTQAYSARRQKAAMDLARLREEFPLLYRGFEQALFTRVAIQRAENAVEHRFEHGELPTKSFNAVADWLKKALATMPEAESCAVDTRALLAQVPLFEKLPDLALDRLARHAREITFLSGDTVIGEGDRGDALYVVRQGNLTVRTRARPDWQGKLSAGDFFGETALLSDSVRSATVVADSACVLLRLTRADVLAVSRSNALLQQALEQAKEERALRA